GVIRIDMKIVMGRRCIETSRDVFPREYGVHARNGQRTVLTDRLDPCMGMYRANNLQVEHSLHRDIHRVMRIAGNNGFAKGALNAGTTGLADLIVFDRDDAMKRIVDGVIPSAAAEISLESEEEVFLFLSRKACGGHDHPRGAKATLIRLSVEKRLLHRMECSVVSEPLHGGDFAAFRSKSGNKTAMHGLAVEPDRACPAIAGIAAFFHAKPAVIANESSQTLSRTRFSTERLSIDLVIHYRFSSSG